MRKGEENFISFYSSIHSEAQKRYSTTEQELLAIISAIEHIKFYLRKSAFLLKDHQALIYFWKSKDKNSRLSHWALDLLKSDFELNTWRDKIIKKENRNGTKIFIESIDERKELINKRHYKTGHGSLETVKYHIRRKYDWKGINKMINKEIQKCEICQKEKDVRTSRCITHAAFWGLMKDGRLT